MGSNFFFNELHRREKHAQEKRRYRSMGMNFCNHTRLKHWSKENCGTTVSLGRGSSVHSLGGLGTL